MIGIQMLSARVGWATGNGLAKNIDKMCPRWLTVSLVGLLVVAGQALAGVGWLGRVVSALGAFALLPREAVLEFLRAR